MEAAVLDHAMFTGNRRSASSSARPVDRPPVDPLGPDSYDDAPVVTSHRRLQRLAIVAAETGARFVRENVAHDPMAWLMAPRALFRGASALDACQDRDGFMRATILHGLGLGLDADADEMDALLDDDCTVEVADEPPLEPGGGSEPVGANRLFTCFVEGHVEGEDRRLQAFCASVVPTRSAMRRHVERRFGLLLAGDAVVHEGLDLNHPAADHLVPDGLLPVLAMAEREPDGEFGRGLDVVLERRFAA